MKAFPLAGTWTAEIKLKNGQISSIERTLHEPGSSAAATHEYVYAAEDWTPPTNISQYVTALSRFPSQNYTVQYSAINGKITTTGLSAVKSSFQTVEPRAYNMYCWLYDVNNTYLGYTDTEFSKQDHSRTGLIGADGELSIVPSLTTADSTGTVDLSKVKYIRILFTDGAQFAPSTYGTFDYRSISALIPVN